MYHIVLSSRYKRSLKRLAKSGRKKDFRKLNEAVNLLASGKVLPGNYKDHELSGTLSRVRECHVKDDLLLIYYKKENVLILVLVDAGSHGELFQ